MPDLSTAAMERLRNLPDPVDQSVIERQPMEPENEYWHQRRDEIAIVLGGLASLQDADIDYAVEAIITGEKTSPLQYQNYEFLAARRAALEAVLADDVIANSLKFQYLTEIEGQPKDVSGWGSHVDAISFLLEKTVEYAHDGLILRLDYTEPEDPGEYRKFLSATPIKIDRRRPSYYLFKRSTAPGDDADHNQQLLSPDSGLYLRYSRDVRDWLAEKGDLFSQGQKVYGIHSTREDSAAWTPFGGYGWSCSEYPIKGPAVFYGQDKITEFVQRMMVWGGARLERLKDDIDDYPGFDFIHDIQPDGIIGTDKKDLAERALI